MGREGGSVVPVPVMTTRCSTVQDQLIYLVRSSKHLLMVRSRGNGVLVDKHRWEAPMWPLRGASFGRGVLSEKHISRKGSATLTRNHPCPIYLTAAVADRAAITGK